MFKTKRAPKETFWNNIENDDIFRKKIKVKCYITIIEYLKYI
jgi:hypothetical protein